MSESLEHRLSVLAPFGDGIWADMLTGIERETLRVEPNGHLSQQPHPAALGSALTHRYITTDFSEAQLEFVTPACSSPRAALDWLDQVHQFAAARIGEERFWNSSMPGPLGVEASIPIAHYGSSNVARMKTIYRRGLSHRYGRPMQTISGVHFNFSLPEAFWQAYAALAKEPAAAVQSSGYLALARNFRRHAWLVLYLYGASPAMCRTFLDGQRNSLAEFDRDTLFEPYATSLRMSDLGYSSNAQSGLVISLNSIQEYVDDLTAAIMTPHAPYAEIGVEVGGQWRQLNTSILQIENEYYSSVRPKQVARSGERPTLALQRAGVQYVEVRCLDINPYEPTGISEAQCYFMQAMLAWCAVRESRLLDRAELKEANGNYLVVAHSGRSPALELKRNGEITLLSDWASELLQGIEAVAVAMSGEDGPHARAVRAERGTLTGEREVLSARVLREMREAEQSFVGFTEALSDRHHVHWLNAAPMPEARFSELRAEVVVSLERQRELEARAQTSFTDYLKDYYRDA
ncbi:MAG: glutamate--cysteine ligase [Pseudomonadota bacterium]